MSATWRTTCVMASIAAGAACTLSVDSERSRDDFARVDRVVQDFLGAPTGIVVGFNPGTCAFSKRMAADLALIGEESSLPVLVVMYGVNGDSVVHARLRADFGLTVPSRLVAESVAVGALRIPPPGIPALIVIRQGQVSLRAYGTSLSKLDSWLRPFLALPPRDRSHGNH